MEKRKVIRIQYHKNIVTGSIPSWEGFLLVCQYYDPPRTAAVWYSTASAGSYYYTKQVSEIKWLKEK